MSFLYEEPINLLKQEVREPAIYTAIITAIATGHSRMSEISSKVGENTNVCARYLKNLISLGIIKREMPYGETNSKKTIYSIEDNMFNFWYRFVLDNNSIIVRGATDLVYKKIEGQLSDYMGRIFEEICTQYLWKQLLEGKSPVEFVSLGRWWGNDAVNKRQVEIDIMGNRIKIRHFWPNVNGEMKMLILMYLKRLLTGVCYFIIPKYGIICFQKLVLQKDV